MAGLFRTRLRLKAGGTLDEESLNYSGGVTLGHFMVSARMSGSRPILTRQLSNGPATQDTDDEGDTLSLDIESSQDTVANRNLHAYAATGGYVDIVALDSVAQEVFEKYGPFKFGNYGTSGQRDAATETVTLVGTGRRREKTWLDSLSDLPDGN